MDILPPAHSHDTEAAGSTEPVAATDPADFDFDQWIDAVERPTKDVPLYNALPPREQLRWTGLEAALADAEARLAKALRDKENGVELAVTDPGIPSIEADVADALHAVQAFRDQQFAGAAKAVVTQVTPDERITGESEGRAAGLPTEYAWLQWAAEHVTLPGGKTPTPAQLLRLLRRDLSGQQQVLAIKRAIESISVVPSVPTSPGSSTSPAGPTPSAS